MDNTLSGSSYERRLQLEIEALNKRLAELNLEKSALERQLIKARQESAGLKDVSRINSINRVMVERRVVEALKLGKSLTNRDLFEKASLVAFDLNKATFRTYLHRMKNKGLIENAEAQGRWRLPSSS